LGRMIASSETCSRPDYLRVVRDAHPQAAGLDGVASIGPQSADRSTLDPASRCRPGLGALRGLPHKFRPLDIRLKKAPIK
jgi:hypothetical protein